MLTFDDVLARLEGARRSGAGFVARCPAHDDRAPSLSLREGDDGRALLKCFAGCAYRDIVAALPRGGSATCAPRIAGASGRADGDRGRVAAALRIWSEARDPRGTIVQDYLVGRGITFTRGAPARTRYASTQGRCAAVNLAIPPSLRFHPALKHPSGARLPAMVAAIDARNGEFAGVHRTFLKPDGTGKAGIEPNKMALGRVSGCAVHLSAGDRAIVLCEGIETGLSILQATGHHVWVALGASNLGMVELSDFVREVIIAADNDPAGIEAARAAAERYRARKLKVEILAPALQGADFNDLAREG
ncbi:MAG TPA: toprim domain-containing protein [Candidatus Binataceae bacterium]|nr:toprim domain-containing protein [Candidatus Binataceae bacterium]